MRVDTSYIYIFFFQAEDGIRDYKVTGVQTCALPISKGIISAAYQKDPFDPQWRDDPEMKAWNAWMDKYNTHVDKSDYYAPYGYNVGHRSEERRVGKECRSRWSPYH